MERLVLRQSYFRTARRLVPLGTPTGDMVAAALERLRDDWPDLPRTEDLGDIVPPSQPCFRRRVAGTALELLYVPTDTGVTVFAVRALI